MLRNPCQSVASTASVSRRPPPEPLPLVSAPRHVCRRCDRALCLCEHLPADGGLDTATRFVIVQSRRERFNALSTGRVVALGLKQCALHWDTDADELLPRPADLPTNAGLLFPGPSATLLSRDTGSVPATFVVIDSTWTEAVRWVRKNSWLADLPRYALAPAPEERSTYRIRRQPKENCLSTVECVSRVLQAVEPGPSADAAVNRLIGAFDALVEMQLDILRNAPRSVRSHVNRVKTTPESSLRSRGLGNSDSIAVAVFGEYYLGRLAGFTAIRIATGEVFHRFVDLANVDVNAQLSSVVAANTQQDELWISWEAATATHRVSPAQFDADWRAWWRGEEEQVVLWSARHAMLAHPLGKSVDALPPGVPQQLENWRPVSLKEAYGALRIARQGGKPTSGPRSLAEAVLAEIGAEEASAAALVSIAAAVGGRAGKALAHTVGLAQTLNAAAQDA